MISAHRVKVPKRRKSFSKEVLSLLDIPSFLKSTNLDRADDISEDIVEEEQEKEKDE